MVYLSLSSTSIQFISVLINCILVSDKYLNHEGLDRHTYFPWNKSIILRLRAFDISVGLIRVPGRLCVAKRARWAFLTGCILSMCMLHFLQCALSSAIRWTLFNSVLLLCRWAPAVVSTRTSAQTSASAKSSGVTLTRSEIMTKFSFNKLKRDLGGEAKVGQFYSNEAGQFTQLGLLLIFSIKEFRCAFKVLGLSFGRTKSLEWKVNIEGLIVKHNIIWNF